MKVGARIVPKPPFARMRIATRRAADLGLDSLWWPDHLMAFLSPAMFDGTQDRVPDEADLHAHVDPFVAIAEVADASGDLLLGTSVTDPVRRMPATLVQTAITLDHLAPGRIVLGLGAGETTNVVPYGWEMRAPGRRFRDAAQEIRRFLDAPGPDERGAVVGLRPPDGSSGPQLWLAAHGPRGLRTAGYVADGWLPTFLSPAEWAPARDEVRRSAVAAGRDPGDVVMGLSLNVVMGERHQDAHDAMSNPAIRRLCLLMSSEQLQAAGLSEHPLGGSGLHTMVATEDPDGIARAARAIPFEVAHRLIPHGTVEEIASLLERYDGLEHVRLSNLGRRGDLLGELAQVAAVAERLQKG